MVNDSVDGMRISRISKLLVDRDAITPQEARARREAHKVTLVCGADVGASYTMQVAVLTAAGLTARCFPGGVRVSLDAQLAESRLLLWPQLQLTFGQALSGLVGTAGLMVDHNGRGGRGISMVFGDATVPDRAVRVTFDGWIAATGPTATVDRLGERECCPLSGVLAASLAVSEIFMSFAKISVEATRRRVALSLWRPSANVRDPAAQGVPIEYLPKELWVLGLGHLGNAYLWALAALHHRNTGDVEVFLNDFDKVEPENVETGLIFTDKSNGKFKTRVCSTWLEARGFLTKIVERRFDEHFCSRSDEPQLALCGFDDNAARRSLETAAFAHVIESGLGGKVDNFDALAVHALPNPRPASRLWPDIASEEDDVCGRPMLAGAAVAVPFIGTTAASFVLAEAVRRFHDGPAYTDLKLRLATPNELQTTSAGMYTAQDAGRLPFVNRT